VSLQRETPGHHTERVLGTYRLRRIYEYCFPWEDRRAREAYGVPSGVNNILIVNRVVLPGRVSAILVRESIGF